MTVDELKRALLSRRPVILRPTVTAKPVTLTYAYVSGIIYRTAGGRAYVQAELTDRGGNSVTIANPKEIFYASEIQQ